MHNDEPTLLDVLGRGSLIREVGNTIATCTPPQVFGVHGDWGLGKTSFLHQVQWDLTGDCPQQSDTAVNTAKARGEEDARGRYKKAIRAVWFDAWRYQNEDAPVVALLQEMRAQLSWQQRAARSAKRKVQVAARGALLSMEELTKKIGFQYSRFRQANRDWEAENLASTLPSHTLREHLQGAIGQLLPRGAGDGIPPRLVIFIDDVDRCEPKAAYHLLEGLKIYLTLDNCIFILGMNQRAIEEAIASSMEIGESRELRAAAYMEKLCQNVWRLPAVREPGEVLHGLLKKTIKSQSIREWIRRAVEGHRCLPPNPRRLKGFANLLGRLVSRLPIQEGEPDDEAAIFETRLLLVVAYVYQFHHDLYVRWEADSGLYDRLYDWCGGNEVDLGFLKFLVLPKQKVGSDSAERTPVPRDEDDLAMESVYPDPTEAGVFWIQPLIRALGEGVESSRFDRYLHVTS